MIPERTFENYGVGETLIVSRKQRLATPGTNTAVNIFVATSDIFSNQQALKGTITYYLAH